MIKFKDNLTVVTEENPKGEVSLYLSDLAEFEVKNEKLRTFALARLKAGEEVPFHKHEGECEYYYIISGEGVYNDNGVETAIVPGAVTFTPSGSSHGIKNTGKELLEFIALIIKD